MRGFKNPELRVGAVVVHYRFWPGVRLTLDSLHRQDLPPQEIVLVDSASQDGSLEQIRAAYPGILVIEAPVNRGYAAAANLGVDHVCEQGVDAVLVVTHECRMARSGLRALSRRLAEDPAVGAVGPLLGYLSRPDEVFSAGVRIAKRTRGPMHLREPREMIRWRGRPPHPVDSVDGACILLRRETLQKIGRFDENYFLYYEETDLLTRVRLHGWRVECVPEAVAWQEPGGVPPYLEARNRLRLLTKFAPRRYVARELVRVLYYAGRDLVGKGDRHDAWPRVRGLADFLRRRWGATEAARSARGQ